MATFGKVLEQIQSESRASPTDRVRRSFLKKLHDLTGRNVVVYYSGWLQKPGPENFSSVMINDEDKHGFMAAFAGLDFTKGLDLVLHTPGGDVAATESIIDYLRSKFGRDIRAIVPQISMSGGTMIALAASEIIMGRHSNLGPIDPQIGGRPAIAIIAEFEKARAEIAATPHLALLWQPILQQYAPTLLSTAEHAIRWTQEIGAKALREGLFADQEDAEDKAHQVVEFLISHDLHRAHGRHLHRNELSQRGLNILDLEGDDDLQDAVLSVHHSCMITVGNTPVAKIIENHLGIAHVKAIQQQVLLAQGPQMPMMPMPPTPVPMPAPMPPAPAPAPEMPAEQAAPADVSADQPSPPRRQKRLVARKVAKKAVKMRATKKAIKARAAKKAVVKRLARKAVTSRLPPSNVRPLSVDDQDG
ncbi:SDH family Clp fold serine proteinase [Bradyrhizobium sp. ERR14]|uniref:SDH family Clp fold serine proteinase n=1 Tax=Bradyrhizobium sp. ERR14 TaxID=2663837 RepID=UPI00160EFCF4|nr:S49 family peptidase [Bradyrhizobium sp. ERR14]MBB4395181.1 hypothetical protein [Bradyrhizobium sp. ERR14]